MGIGTTRVLTAAALAALAAACGGGGGAGEPPPAAVDLGTWGRVDDGWAGDGPRLAVLGDSIAHLARTELAEALDDWSLRVAAVVGEGWEPGAWSQVHGSDLIEDAATDIAEDDPEVVVWVLGTNDAWDAGRDLDESLAEIAEMAERFPDACIVAVEVNEQATADGFDPAKAAAINEALRAASDLTVAPDSGTLQPDGIHPTVEGQDALADLVADAVDRCPGG